MEQLFQNSMSILPAERHLSSNEARCAAGLAPARTLEEQVMLAQQMHHPVREIVDRTHGRTHGPIPRLVSPSDLGELIKPFVFLDLFDFDGRAPPAPMELGWHPHSGIATVTVMFDGSVRYAETTGKAGVLP